MSRTKIYQRLINRDEILATTDRLHRAGFLSDGDRQEMGDKLDGWLGEIEYILFNLAVHLSMGAFRVGLAIPIPFVGTVARLAWILGNKVVWTVRRDQQKAKVHSKMVCAVALIPGVGYGAYTIPMRRVSDLLAYVYAEHICHIVSERSVQEVLSSQPKPIRRISQTILVPAGYRSKPVAEDLGEAS